MTRPIIAAVVALLVGVALIVIGETRAETGCGVERATVKHLTDGFKLPAFVHTATVDQLLALHPPQVGSQTPRLPQERILIRILHAHIIAVKQEPDSDLHVILQGSSGELNVEAPMAVCVSSSPYAPRLTAARAALDKAFPNASTGRYTPENLRATVTGVLFFDVLHGQRGAANGAELHPLTRFVVG